MSLNKNKTVSAEFLEKYISVKAMKEILSKLEDTDLLYPNRVGNLTIVRSLVDIGYIDISVEVMYFLEK